MILDSDKIKFELGGGVSESCHPLSVASAYIKVMLSTDLAEGLMDQADPPGPPGGS